MMTHADASILMEHLTTLSKKNLDTSGYAYPMLFLTKKGEDFEISSDHDLVMDQKKFVVREGRVITDKVDHVATPDTFFVWSVLFRFRSLDDESVINQLTRDLTEAADPDMVGYVSCCFYNEYRKGHEPSDEEVLNDHTTISMLQVSYYLKSDRVARLVMRPFINRGKVKSEIPGLDDENAPYDILMAGSGWIQANSLIDVKIKDPYRR